MNAKHVQQEEIHTRPAIFSDEKDVERAVLIQIELQEEGRSRYGQPPMPGDYRGLLDQRFIRLLSRSDLGAKVWFGFVQDSLAGICIAQTNMSSWNLSPVLNCHDLYVRRQFRRKGVAVAMLDSLLETAVSMGCSHVSLETNLGNISARKLYKSLGFESTGLNSKGQSTILDQSVESERDSQIVIQMTKRLSIPGKLDHRIS